MRLEGMNIGTLFATNYEKFKMH